MRTDMTETHLPELLRSEETRVILGLGRSAFYELARRDALPIPTIRLGRRFMFSRRALEALLNKQQPDSSS